MLLITLSITMEEQKPIEDEVTVRSESPAPAGLQLEASQEQSLSAIRSATAFARLPLHQLSKKGKINIRIIERGSTGGQISLKWVVSPNAEYGMPGQLAYKIDTIVIQARLNNLTRPYPRIIRVGTLTDIARELDHVDGDTATIKHALLQNASSFVTAKLKYKTADGEATIGGKDEVGFTRYAIRFRGEQVDGHTIECVYLILNDPYYDVLNNSAMQPLDQNYRKVLTAGAQRFYEILSFEMFTAFKYPNVRAKLQYSQFCMIAPQTRYYDKRRMQIQMAKIHRPHIANGYITKARYENIIDGEGQPDWMLTYIPGTRAVEEYQFFNGRRLTLPATPPRQQILKEPAIPVDATLLAELTKRGIGERKAREILAAMNGQDVVGQLEYTDYLIAQAPPEKFHNPAGLYIARLIERTPVPSWFETAAKRRERMERERLAAERLRLEAEYQKWRQEQEIGRWNTLSEEERMTLVAEAKADITSRTGDQGIGLFKEEFLQRMAERRVRKKLSNDLATFDDWTSGRIAS